MAGEWWKIEITPEQSIGPFQDAFWVIFNAHGAPRGAAMFCDDLSSGSIALLFSPKAASVAQSYLKTHGGVACNEPDRGTFLAGHDDDRTMLSAPKRTY